MSPARYVGKFANQSNFHGQYFFANGVNRHVWHESMGEYTALMWLDHRESVAGVAAQPMTLFFFDDEGKPRRHTPDYFVLLEDGRQRVLDVRPAENIGEVERMKFAKTKEICERVGWEYHLFTGIPLLVRNNLEWLSGYRLHRYAPSPGERAEVHALVGDGATFGEVYRQLEAELPARRVHHIYHLMWRRDLVFDLTQPLSMSTTLRSATE